MDDDIAKVDHDPAIRRAPFTATVQLEEAPGSIHHRVCQSIQHAVAGSVRQNKIICKCSEIMDVKQEEVFALFILQSIHQGTSNINRSSQNSPHKIDS